MQLEIHGMDSGNGLGGEDKMIDISTKEFIESATSLAKELDSFKSTLFSGYPDYASAVKE